MRRLIQSLGDMFPAFLHSIRFRLTLWFVCILAIVLAGFSIFIYWTQSRDLRSDAVGHLQEEDARIQSFFHDSEWELSDVSPADIPGSSVLLPKGDLLILVDTNGTILQQWGQQISKPDALITDLWTEGGSHRDLTIYQKQVQVADQDGQSASADYLFITTPIMQDESLRGYLVVGSMTDLISQQHRLAVSLTLGSLGMLAIAFLGGLWLADRAMRPVASIALAARNITESDLGRRLNMRGRDELADLAATFDGMISRLQTAFDRQRRFVADASHELRTPLTIINLEVGRVLEGQRPAAEYKRALQVVDAEGSRMTRLVNDLMTLARMDSGQTILHFEELDLSGIALEAVGRMSALAAQRQVSLEPGESSQVPVRGDRQYLLQMVSNLLENGVKYCGIGQQVRVDTSRQGGKALLRVSDTGPGISPEHLPALFDRFYRVDQSRSQNDDDPASPPGSGLGLSIVAWIVRAHDGEIRVQSRIDEGTAFEVLLPLSRSSRVGPRSQ